MKRLSLIMVASLLFVSVACNKSEGIPDDEDDPDDSISTQSEDTELPPVGTEKPDDVVIVPPDVTVQNNSDIGDTPVVVEPDPEPQDIFEEQEIADMREAMTIIREFLRSEDYRAMSFEDKYEAVERLLHTLAFSISDFGEPLIIAESIVFDDNTQSFSFQYGTGVYSGVRIT